MAIDLNRSGPRLLEFLYRGSAREKAVPSRHQVPPEENGAEDEARYLDDAKPRSVFDFGVIFHWTSDL
jgi:hypothetical protein